MIIEEADKKNISIVKTLIKDGHPTKAKYLLNYFCQVDYSESRGGNPEEWPYLEEYWDQIFEYFNWSNEVEF